MKCLVIEDDDDLGELWLAHLEACGIRADVARNLHEASSKILTHDYDVVISDIDLPDGNGMELTHLLAFRQPDTPVVVVHQGTNQTDFGAAARVYWTLKSSGIAPLAILNGGMNAWAAAGACGGAEPGGSCASMPPDPPGGACGDGEVCGCGNHQARSSQRVLLRARDGRRAPRHHPSSRRATA